MARATKTIRKTVKHIAEPAPRKRPGRPLGSKNRPKVAATAKAAPVARTTRAAPRKSPASATPKPSKAELEQQVVKLERAILRLRKQNTELKHAAREEAVPAPIAKSRRTPKRAAAPAPRRGVRAKADPAAETPAASAAVRRTSSRSVKAEPAGAAGPDVAHEDAPSDNHEDEAAAED